MACSGIPYLTSEVGENFVNQLQCAVLDRDPTFDRYAEHKDVVNRHNNLVLLPSEYHLARVVEISKAIVLMSRFQSESCGTVPFTPKSTAISWVW
jgi:hypothetical protein